MDITPDSSADIRRDMYGTVRKSGTGYHYGSFYHHRGGCNDQPVDDAHGQKRSRLFSCDNFHACDGLSDLQIMDTL
jgi:hypothetical protein